LSGFFIGGGLFIPPKVRGVQSSRVHLQFIRQKGPRHGDGLLFEVISKGPIPKHFKKGVVVNILPNIVEIIVFTTRTDAFLRIDSTFQIGHGKGGITCAQEERLVLIHPRVGKQQGWIIDGDTGT
jgi:hypothetical protein